MNAFGFLRLLRAIYGNKAPDLGEIQAQGLLAVKIAQHYALRVDFLDPEVCRHLSKLYRSTLPMPPAGLRAQLNRHVGPEWLAEFESIEEEPLASASIGQVHRGRLKDGSPVVVKVIKADNKAAFLADLASLRRLMRLLLLFYPKLNRVFDPLGVLAHIEEYTLLELDLRNERAGLDTLAAVQRAQAGRYDLSRLRFPVIYDRLTGENVMTSGFVEGETFDELLERGALPYETLLELFNIHGFFIFSAGVFHGDLHPGNVILGRGGELYFVDTGALSRTTGPIKDGLFGFFEALCAYDYPLCAERLNAMAVRGIDGRAMARFRPALLDLYRDFKGSTVSEISLTRRMMETIRLGVDHGMVFEKGMFPVIKSLMYMDGMVLRCNPRADLIKDVGRFAGRLRACLPAAG